MSTVSPCPGCYAELAIEDLPTHRYIGASPACWDVYTRFLAGDPSFPISRWSALVVDAYAAQHPGGDTPQATQSAAVHLVVLNAMLRRGHPLAEAIQLRRAAVEAGRLGGGYPKLEPVAEAWALTIPEIAPAPEGSRGELVDTYVEDVLERWVDLHGGVIEEWYRRAVG